jgi:hypothetical protein
MGFGFRPRTVLMPNLLLLKGWERSYTQVKIDVIFLLFSLEGIFIGGENLEDSSTSVEQQNFSTCKSCLLHPQHTLCLDPF